MREFLKSQEAKGLVQKFAKWTGFILSCIVFLILTEHFNNPKELETWIAPLFFTVSGIVYLCGIVSIVFDEKQIWEMRIEYENEKEPDDGMDLNESWLNGKYDNGEIDTNLGYIVYQKEILINGEDGRDAIKEIHQKWLSGKGTQEDAFNWYCETHLN